MKKRIVLTGGPSGGKTTALSIIKESFGHDVELVKEAATLIYSGGYPRKDGSAQHTYHGQRIIYYVSKELEELADESSQAPIVVCDRGTLDGAVYWPYGQEDFLKNMGTTKEAEFARYDMIIHLSPPMDESFYQATAVRTETLEGALQIDQKILDIWAGHPNRLVIDKHATYFDKAKIIKEVIANILQEIKK
ncbi:putative ATPase [Elusimicrobium simillimum]|uniref:ATP/GTP-binding protein n=1 Tax=Elusimicrobium simillimum TaxID=3143438 RepID=UPI003C6EA478